MLIFYKHLSRFQTEILNSGVPHALILRIRSASGPDTANLLAQLHVDIEAMTGLSTTIGYSKTADSFSLVMGLFAQANAAKDSTSSASVIGYEDIQTESSRKNMSGPSKEHVRKMKEYIAEHYKEPITMHRLIFIWLLRKMWGCLRRSFAGASGRSEGYSIVRFGGT